MPPTRRRRDRPRWLPPSHRVELCSDGDGSGPKRLRLSVSDLTGIGAGSAERLCGARRADGAPGLADGSWRARQSAGVRLWPVAAAVLDEPKRATPVAGT